jgi:ATP-dependent DNA helicase RecG
MLPHNHISLSGSRYPKLLKGALPCTLTLRFFYFTAAQEAQMERGVKLRCFGETRRGPMGLGAL